MKCRLPQIDSNIPFLKLLKFRETACYLGCKLSLIFSKIAGINFWRGFMTALRNLKVLLIASVAFILSAGSAIADEAFDFSKEFPPELLEFNDNQFAQTISTYRKYAPEEDPGLSWSLLGPFQASAHKNLGIYYYNLNDLDRAETEYLESMSLNPVDPATHYNLGILHSDRNEYSAAREAYETAIKLDPEMSHAHFNLGNLHLAEKNYTEAEGAFKKALSIDPEDLGARVNLGHIYFYVQGNLLEARRQYEDALKLKPDLARLKVNLAKIDHDLTQSRKAEARFEKNLKQSPGISEESFNAPAPVEETTQASQSKTPKDLFRF